MLFIGEFSEMCRLSPQTLRFYHSEGLLPPAGVDEQTGYRYYLFEQVEQAMLITVLRRTGMSVRAVRSALEEPDNRLALLEEHHREVQRRRDDEDEAIDEARRFFDSWPQPRVRRAPAMTVVSKRVPAPETASGEFDWAATGAAVTAAVAEVAETVESCGAAVSGTPWRAWANETPEQRTWSRSPNGAPWLVKVPFTAEEPAGAALSQKAEVQDFAARDELSIFIPGRDALEKYTTALSRLTQHPLGAAYIDITCMRFILHDNGVESTAAIRPLGESGSVPLRTPTG